MGGWGGGELVTHGNVCVGVFWLAPGRILRFVVLHLRLTLMRHSCVVKHLPCAVRCCLDGIQCLVGMGRSLIVIQGRCPFGWHQAGLRGLLGGISSH